MMNRSEEERKDIYRRLFIQNGPDAQMVVCMEECAELIKEISKYFRYGNKGPLVEEIADVRIMLEQLVFYLDIQEKVDKMVEYKIDRIVDRLGGD